MRESLLSDAGARAALCCIQPTLYVSPGARDYQATITAVGGQDISDYWIVNQGTRER